MEQLTEQSSCRAAESPLRAPQAARAVEPHIFGLFPAQVRGVDSSGAQFHTQTLIDNFSATEFELRLGRHVAAGGKLLVVADIHAATVALHGKVLCAEPLDGGAYRLTVAVTHHRFL
jgi:hypothetical protein